MSKPKRRGRPKGAKNKDYSEHVVELPPRCPHCGVSDSAVVVGGSKSPPPTPHRGVKGGQAYTHIEKTRMVCNHCGRRYIRYRYHNRKDNTARIKQAASGEDS